MNEQKSAAHLHRGLKNRHIQLIALGGAIGTGLFLGIAHTAFNNVSQRYVGSFGLRLNVYRRS